MALEVGTCNSFSMKFYFNWYHKWTCPIVRDAIMQLGTCTSITNLLC